MVPGSIESTLDHLTRLDMAWRNGILQDLYRVGIKGRMAKYVKGFLEDRQFRDRVDDALSSVRIHQAEVPQGSTLSVTLFAMKIASVNGDTTGDICANVCE